MPPRILVTWAGLALLISAVPAAAQQWMPQGPAPSTRGQVEGIRNQEVAGAIRAIAVHPANPNTIYVAAVNGGLWMTTNASAPRPHWVEQLGPDRSQSIGAIAFDPDDASVQTLVAGSGRFSSYMKIGGDRAGLWRTTDGGANWIPITGGGRLTRLNISAVEARGPTLIVGADAADNPADQGIWRSVDGGANWSQVSGAAATGLPVGAVLGIGGSLSHREYLFANAGNRGIYRSRDLGATWAKVSTPAMDEVMNRGTTNVRIAVGAGENLYVALAVGTNGASRLAGLFRSADLGDNWMALDLPTTPESGVKVGIHPGGQGSLHLSMVADRNNPSVVYLGGDRQPERNEFTSGRCPCFPNSIGANTYSGRLFRIDASKPAGQQATHITHSNTGSGSAPHADSRDMAMAVNGDLIEADDGGIYRRTQPLGNSGDWVSLNGDLQIAEFHSVAWDRITRTVIGGTQDTGTPEQPIAAGQEWESVNTGDGGKVAVDDFGSPGVSVRFSSAQGLGGFRRRTFDASRALLDDLYPPLTPLYPSRPLRPRFETPVVLNNVNSSRMVIAGEDAVYESSDQGDTISEIGAGIVVNEGGPIGYGAGSNQNMLYLGVGDRVLVRGSAAPAAPTESLSYPGARTGNEIVAIAVQPDDPKTAYVADMRTIYRTTDGGATWTNITGNLLRLGPGPIRSMVYYSVGSDRGVIVGGNAGVFIQRGAGGTAWTRLGSGLPRGPVYGLDFDSADRVLVAGLLGRGAWTLALSPNP